MPWMMYYLRRYQIRERESQQADWHIKQNVIAHQSWVGEGGPRASAAWSLATLTSANYV